MGTRLHGGKRRVKTKKTNIAKLFNLLGPTLGG